MGQLIWNVATTFFAIVAIAVAVLLYLRGKKEKQPTWCHDSHGLVGLVSELGGHLKVLYDETPVRQVTSTRIVFWNAGRDSILKNDIATAYSVQFPEGVEILTSSVVASSRPEIEFQTPITGRSVGLEFKFLGHGDGADLEVLHTGPPDVSLEMSGSLVSDAREARRKAWPLQTADSWLLRMAALAAPAALAVGAVWAVWVVVAEVAAGAAGAARAAVVTGAAVILMALIIFPQELRRGKKGYPAWLRKPKQGAH